jgi:hypothetical protein
MKKIIFTLLSCYGLFLSGIAQTVFWSENFNNGCTEGCFANAYVSPNGAWGVNNAGGTNGLAPNQWFVSCAENNTGVGSCSSACGANATLHLGANPLSFCTCFVCFGLNGDCGAAYDACSFNLCSGSSPATSRRAFSPNINTIGQTGITLSFIYIENGQGTTDNATVQYSIDGGTTWLALADPAKTPTCAGGGIWTTFSIALPAACENITTLRIGFVWNNNIDGVGSDPSFAVDDVQLSVGSALPALFADFTVKNQQGKNIIRWQNQENIQGTYYLERSHNGTDFYELGVSQKDALQFIYVDEKPFNGTNFYRIHFQDKDGNHYYSHVHSINVQGVHYFEATVITYQNQQIGYYLNASDAIPYTLKVYDMTGKMVLQISEQAQTGLNYCTHPCSLLSKGIYQAVFYTQEGIVSKKLWVE